jgi:hypothetical protein
MLARGWREVWAGFSTRSAAAAGVTYGLAAGGPADYCLWEESARGMRVTVMLEGTPRREHFFDPSKPEIPRSRKP